MIYKNNKTINEWYFNDAELIKVYKNGAICYYKIVNGSTPSQEPCFAVVDNIQSYSDTEFIDVYDKATEKWYKLNNLDQYEEYGIYGSGRTITYYEGKLTIDNGYEYEWDGSEWDNLGEVSGSSIIIHSPEYLERTSSSSGYLPLGETFQLNTIIEMDFQMTQAKGNAIIGDYGTNDSNDWRLFLNYDSATNNLLSYDFLNTRAQYNTGNWAKRFNLRIGNYYVIDIDTGTRLINSTRKTSFTRPNQMYLFHMEGSQITNNTDYGHIYSVKIYQDGTLVKDYIPWTDGNGTYGMWDKVSNQSVASVGQMTGSSVVHDIDVGDDTVYPKYYTEKDEPENDVVFEDMEEALAYECPWVGMRAIIGGDRYIFTSGYTWEEDTSIVYATLQELAQTHTVVQVASNKYTLEPTISGITFFRLNMNNYGNGYFTDLYRENLDQTNYFGLKDDSNGSLYKAIDGYSTIKDAANSSSCTWAYWIDQNTIEVNVVDAVQDTIFLAFYTNGVSMSFLSLPVTS